jgi:hypothetical protein
MSRAGKFDYTDELIVQRIQEMAAQCGGVLTLTDYRRLQREGDPSIPAIVVRRKWSEWVTLAGVKMGRPEGSRTTVEKRYDVDDALEALTRFYLECQQTGMSPTHANYEVWQKGKPNTPCGSTARYRLRERGITWTQAVSLIRQEDELERAGELAS